MVDRNDEIEATSGSDGLDDPVLVVHDHTMATTVAVLLDALEEAKMIFPLVLAYVHAVGIAGPGVSPTAPYKILHPRAISTSKDVDRSGIRHTPSLS